MVTEKMPFFNRSCYFTLDRSEQQSDMKWYCWVNKGRLNKSFRKVGRYLYLCKRLINWLTLFRKPNSGIWLCLVHTVRIFVIEFFLLVTQPGISFSCDGKFPQDIIIISRYLSLYLSLLEGLPGCILYRCRTDVSLRWFASTCSTMCRSDMRTSLMNLSLLLWLRSCSFYLNDLWDGRMWLHCCSF